MDANNTPAVCDDCLGSNPYVEMLRQRNGAECKICTKPFTVFKWKSESNNQNGKANFKKTVICLTCARSKNCCQSCLLDLTFGIDIKTRDKLMKIAKLEDGNNNNNNNVITNAKNVTSKLYNSNQLEEKYQDQEIVHAFESDADKELLINNLQKYIDKKDMSKTDADNNVKNKSNNVITKNEFYDLIKVFPFNGNLIYKPKNSNIKSLFLFGTDTNLTISKISDYFINLSTDFDKSIISSVYTQSIGKFGFIEFSSRIIAEKIASLIYQKHIAGLKNFSSDKDVYKSPCLIVIDRKPIRVCWCVKLDMSAASFDNTQLNKISKVVDKQLLKLAKSDVSNKPLVSSKSKISKK